MVWYPSVVFETIGLLLTIVEVPAADLDISTGFFSVAFSTIDISTFFLYGSVEVAFGGRSPGSFKTGVIAIYALEGGGGRGAGSKTKSRARIKRIYWNYLLGNSESILTDDSDDTHQNASSIFHDHWWKGHNNGQKCNIQL